MTDSYCVFGNPVAHSKSPVIHGEFARLTGQDIHYEAKLADKDGFTQAAHDFFAAGGKGCNVTVPFKEEAWSLAEVRSRRAEKAGAVNTLMLGKDGRLYGDNTDGAGLLCDMQDNAGWELRGRRVLLLGAGGAARGVVSPLLAARPAMLVIANRTPARAQELVRLFADEGPVTGGSYDTLAGQTFDLVINATSASLGGELPPLPAGLLAPGAQAYDMMYGAVPTVFLQWAAAQGAQTRDGLGMLVEQAAEAFFLWRQVRPPTSAVLSGLRAALTPA
ncbi:MAG: shikimate dehydrogenase [Moraxellaceae bacterium]|nr:shikimate dehydrogenase [Moraxellaceae bacterium]